MLSFLLGMLTMYALIGAFVVATGIYVEQVKLTRDDTKAVFLIAVFWPVIVVMLARDNFENDKARVVRS